MSTLLCVPILVESVEAALADAAAAKEAGADLVEFRVDQVFTGAKGRTGEEEVQRVVHLASRSPLPCIVTCRAASEGGGGGYDGDDMARVSLYERLGTAAGKDEHPPRYIDVEWATYTRSANLKQKVNLAVSHASSVRELASGLILSMHDLDGRPADLLRRLAAMQAEPAASLVKVAYRARSLRDNLELFDLVRENAGGAGGGKPMIALGMGEFGLMSRVLAPKFGGFLTFASLRPESATAPGQPTVEDLLELYRFRSIGPRTKVYGVIGWPVGHSLSPLVHNAGFAAIGADAVYLPLPVPPEYEHFKATLGALIDHESLDFSGCSVTLPHKENLVRFAEEEDSRGTCRWDRDELSELCGAANTLVVERNDRGEPARCNVTNTDGKAALACMSGAMRSRLMGGNAACRIGLVGAGGVARAIAGALAQGRAKVVVFNRSRERAERLCAELNKRAQLASPAAPAITAANMAELATIRCDAYVNCTPIGMRGGPAPTESAIPIDVIRSLPAETVIMDTVYTPVVTPLLRAAEDAGMATLDGLQLFVSQALLQFKAWTGREGPPRVFNRVASEAHPEREIT